MFKLFLTLVLVFFIITDVEHPRMSLSSYELVIADLFIAENFDVVRYSVFKEQIYIRYITDIKSYQFFTDRILYPLYRL